MKELSILMAAWLQESWHGVTLHTHSTCRTNRNLGKVQRSCYQFPDVGMIVHVLHVWSYTLQFTKMLAQGKQKRRDMGPSLSSLQRPMGFNYLKMKDILSIWKICGNGVVCLAGTCSACLCCIWSFTLLSASHVSFRTILQIYLWL